MADKTEAFRIGEIVWLNSGGVPFTITGFPKDMWTGQVSCSRSTWHGVDTHMFDPACLTRIDPNTQPPATKKVADDVTLTKIANDLRDVMEMPQTCLHNGHRQLAMIIADLDVAAKPIFGCASCRVCGRIAVQSEFDRCVTCKELLDEKRKGGAR